MMGDSMAKIKFFGPLSLDPHLAGEDPLALEKGSIIILDESHVISSTKNERAPNPNFGAPPGFGKRQLIHGLMLACFARIKPRTGDALITFAGAECGSQLHHRLIDSIRISPRQFIGERLELGSPFRSPMFDFLSGHARQDANHVAI